MASHRHDASTCVTKTDTDAVGLINTTFAAIKKL